MPEGGSSHVCTFDVTSLDIDHMGHVNNTVYLRWVQEAVTAFWMGTAPSDVVDTVSWVALRHEITYRAPAFLDQQVEVLTLAQRLVGAKAHFEATIRRGGTVLADVRSIWCSLDAASLQPVRLATEVRDLFFERVSKTA